MEHAFSWNAWNLEHATSHGVTRDEIEYAVNNAEAPFPWPVDEDKFVVWAWSGARHIQVVFIFTRPERYVYVIHSRPLEMNEWRQFED